MTSHPYDHNASDENRTLDPIMFSFLWHHTAAMAAHYLGLAEVPAIPDAYRIDCVQRLGALYLHHRDVLDDSASRIMAILAHAALDLRNVSDH